jgi:hypothetical protein
MNKHQEALDYFKEYVNILEKNDMLTLDELEKLVGEIKYLQSLIDLSELHNQMKHKVSKKKELS